MMNVCGDSSVGICGLENHEDYLYPEINAQGQSTSPLRCGGNYLSHLRETRRRRSWDYFFPGESPASGIIGMMNVCGDSSVGIYGLVNHEVYLYQEINSQSKSTSPLRCGGNY